MRLSFADGLFWTSVASCAIAQLFIVRSVLGTRRAEPPAASSPARSRASSSMELFWAVVPAVALVVLLLFTWRAIRSNRGALPLPVPTSAAEAPRAETAR